MDRIEREEIKQRINELNALRDEHPEHADLIFHQVNDLLDRLEAEESPDVADDSGDIRLGTKNPGKQPPKARSQH